MADGIAWDLATVGRLGARGDPSRALATEPSACVEWPPAVLIPSLNWKPNLDWIETG